MIPLLFGVQQIIEGMLWLSFRFDAPLLNVIMTYVFTLFSHVLWPIFVPFSIGLMETVAWRKKVISAIPDHRDRGWPVPSLRYRQISCHFRS